MDGQVGGLAMIDPYIGTGGVGFGAGNHNPGAQVPHGGLRGIRQNAVATSGSSA